MEPIEIWQMMQSNICSVAKILNKGAAKGKIS